MHQPHNRGKKRPTPALWSLCFENCCCQHYRNGHTCFYLRHFSMMLSLNQEELPQAPERSHHALPKISSFFFFFCARSEMMKVKLPHSLALRGGYDPGGCIAALRGEIIACGREQKVPGSGVLNSIAQTMATLPPSLTPLPATKGNLTNMPLARKVRE